MPRVFVQYNNENFPNKIKNLPKYIQNFGQYLSILLKIAKDLKNEPMWRNFAKSGHTGCNGNSL